MENYTTKEIADGLICQLAASMQDFFNFFDLQEFVRLVDFLVPLKGYIIASGVGKSGFVAQKMAATMNSVGISALFLSPQDALHGDLGIIRPGDVALLFSKSGQTDELVQLAPAIRAKGAQLVAIVASKAPSRLSASADFCFVLPELKEICPFDLAPTTSAISQLIFGDLLAISLMQKRGVTRESFILNHPAGRLGKRELVRVKDLMLSADRLPLCRDGSPLREILVELSDKKCGCVCIVDSEKRLLGIFTDGDLRRAIQRYGNELFSCSITSLMTRGPKVVAPDMLAYEAMVRMESDPRAPITVLPVVDEASTVVGLIRMHDIVQAGL